VPNCARGARKNNEVHDISWQIALAIETANSDNTAIGGISIDKRIFFDLLQHQIGHSSLRQLGAPSLYIDAQERFYANLRYRFKINKSFSHENTRTNGFAQGDSYSLQVALATMAFWTYYIQNKSRQITTGSFVDDSHFYSSDPSMDVVASRVAKAWLASQTYDERSGLETNIDKTFIFANSQQLEPLWLCRLEMSAILSLGWFSYHHSWSPRNKNTLFADSSHLSQVAKDTFCSSQVLSQG